MEERALLSSFPAGISPVTTLGFRGARVLTATTCQALQSSVTHAIQSFENGVITAFDNNNVKGVSTEAFFTTVGIATTGQGPNFWSYALAAFLPSLTPPWGPSNSTRPLAAAWAPTQAVALDSRTRPLSPQGTRKAVVS